MGLVSRQQHLWENADGFFLIHLDCKPDKYVSFISILWNTGPKYIFLCYVFPEWLIRYYLSIHNLMFARCLQHFKSKEKVSTTTSVGFKTVKEYAKKWTAVEKGPSSFQNFHLMDKCNTITAELLENETVKCHPPVPPRFHKWHKIKQNIKTTNKRKRRDFNSNHTRATARRTFPRRQLHVQS